nr:C-C motif chemokine 4 homolog [Paramormyrops kingsleyae]
MQLCLYIRQSRGASQTRLSSSLSSSTRLLLSLSVHLFPSASASIQLGSSEGTMKTLPAVLFLVLLCSVQLVYSNAPGLAASCCADYYNKRIPLSQIVSFYETNPSCPLNALVFVTNRNRSFCVNPDEAWVSTHVSKLDNRKTTD